MKIRLLEKAYRPRVNGFVTRRGRSQKKLEKSGYHFVRNGQGSHRIFKHEQTHQRSSVSGKKGSEEQPYQLKVLRAKSKTIHALVFA